MKVIIKLILVIILLGCLLNLPYGYYQFVRVTSFIGFFILCYTEHREGRPVISVLCGMAGILLNPFFSIHFTRSNWNRIYLYLAMIMCCWIFYDLVFDPKSSRKSKKRNW